METLHILEKAMLLAVYISMPPLIVAVVVGVLVALIQTLVQVQDQTLPFAIKLVAVALTLAITGSWMGGELMNLTNLIFDAVPGVGVK